MKIYRSLLTITTALSLLLSPIANAYSVVSSVEDKIVDFVYSTVDTVRYTAYKMGGSRFDPRKGVYILDCSSYVGEILRNVSPHAFLNLVRSKGSTNPNTVLYYDFFSNLSRNNPYWNKVNHIKELRPGDIIVFRYKKHKHAQTRGHIMVVMEKPIQKSNSYKILVSDAAPIRHSDDTRSKYKSGIGVGTVLIKENPQTGQPAAYAWQMGSRWRKNVQFAMARPKDTV